MPRDASMIDLYDGMLRIRAVEDAIIAHYAEQEMRCPVHLCIGQEAAAVGVCAALRRTDYALSGHRSHGHYLAKGGDLTAMMAEIYGKAAGCASGKGGSMHLIDLDAGFLGAAPIVGSTIPIGVGVAFGAWQRGEDSVCAVFFGDGATESGVLHESLNFAALKKLPVIFACENNFYSVYSPMGVRQPDGRPITALAEAHGIPAATVDGNDVQAVYAAAREAVARARSGNGPTFIEMTTYRWREHCGPNLDNDIGYRTEAEYEEWRGRCPVESLERKLAATGLLGLAEAGTRMAAFRAEAEAAIAFAKAAPFPPSGEMATGVYASPIGAAP